MSARSTSRRRAFGMVLALMATALLVLLMAVVLRFAALEIARERTALLESTANAICTSARGWARVNRYRLEAGRVVAIPIGDLLATPVSGSVELARESGDASRVTCRLQLVRGRESIRRTISWTVSGGERRD